MSVVSKIILKADDELRYPTSGELQGLKNFLGTGEMRVRIAETLADSERKIVDEAGKQLFRQHPDYRGPGGNASGQRQYNQCLRDFRWYLRLVTYGVLSGDIDSIETIGVVGAREMYNSLGVPLVGMADSVRCLKEASLSLLNNEDASEAAPYFDYLIQALS
jgi:allophycocyanin-B